MDAMYDNKFTELANQKYNDIVSCNDEDAIGNEHLVIKKIYQTLNNLDTIKVSNADELINVFDMVN